MKRIIIAILLFACTATAFSQSRYTIVQLNKKDVPGIIGEIPFTENTVRDAIDKNFEKLGYKSRKQKEYKVYSGVLLKELGAEPHDLYVMVDRKSRQDKDVSIVTMLVSKGFDNFANDTADAGLINNTKAYINGLRDIAAAYDLELQIAEQEEVTNKNEKKSANLVEDSVSLQKKKKKLDLDIMQNSGEQTNQKAENNRQRQILETLKNKRKPTLQSTEIKN
jgi:hypothetical protein